jgi:hypothetical protein
MLTMIGLRSVAVASSAIAVFSFGILFGTSIPAAAGVDDACYLTCVNSAADVATDNRCKNNDDFQSALNAIETEKKRMNTINTYYCASERTKPECTYYTNEVNHNVDNLTRAAYDCKRYLQTHNKCSNQCVSN